MGSSRLTSRRRQDPGFKWARISMAGLATIGVIDTGSITLNRWGWLGSLSCPGGAENCDKVLNSPWGTIFQNNGLAFPLSLLGLLSYLAILLMAIIPLLPGLSENKTQLSRRTWWGLFVASCCMSVFSLILIWLMIFKIQAYCFFCVVSAFISIALLVLVLIGGGWDDLGEVLFRGIFLSLAVLIGGLIWATALDPNGQKIALNQGNRPPRVENISNPYQIELAKHLSASGAIMYSAYWCPHCHDQKEMFGQEAVKELRVVECASDGFQSQQSLCESKGINAFPSWEINQTIDSGIKSLKELAFLSGFK